MKILIDCSSLRIGGGIQVGLSLLGDFERMNLEHEFVVVLSYSMTLLVDYSKFSKNFSFYEIPIAKEGQFFYRKKILKRVEKEISPNVVFSVFGPCFYRFKAPNLVGYAIPKFLKYNSPYFKELTFKENVLLRLERAIKVYLFKKNSDALVFETKLAQTKFLEQFTYNKPTFCVSNQLNSVFLEPEKWEHFPLKTKKTKIILCVASNYKHKNLKIIPFIINELLTNNITDFQFVVTLTKNQLGLDSCYDPYISYIAKVNLKQLPKLYQQADVLFFPTLLEVFSVTYLEAMFMKLPIVTTDLEFARDICADGALYFKPTDIKQASKHIENLLMDKELKTRIVKQASVNFTRFGTSLDRTRTYLEILEKISR